MVPGSEICHEVMKLTLLRQIFYIMFQNPCSNSPDEVFLDRGLTDGKINSLSQVTSCHIS